jgi:hypothetical protein
VCTEGGSGFRMYECFYTPTLHATCWEK